MDSVFISNCRKVLVQKGAIKWQISGKAKITQAVQAAEGEKIVLWTVHKICTKFKLHYIT